MKKASLFQYAILWQPTDEEVKNGQKAKLIVDVKTIVATDDSTAFMVASRDVPEEYLECLDQVNIAVRPF